MGFESSANGLFILLIIVVVLIIYSAVQAAISIVKFCWEFYKARQRGDPLFADEESGVPLVEVRRNGVTISRNGVPIDHGPIPVRALPP